MSMSNISLETQPCEGKVRPNIYLQPFEIMQSKQHSLRTTTYKFHQLGNVFVQLIGLLTLSAFPIVPPITL